jgi:hypothetical protein
MSDDMPGPLDPELEALLDSERRAPGAPAQARDRVRSRLAVSLGLVGLSGAASGATPPVGTSAVAPKLLSKALFGKLAIGTVAAVGLGLGVHYAFRAPSPPPAAPRVEAPRVAAPPVTPAPPAEVAPIAAPPAAAPQAAAPATVPSPSRAAAEPHRSARPATDDLAAERALLEPARAALSHGDAASALQAVARHAARFPHGQLVEERESLSIRALVISGRPDEARARAAAFRARWPKSIFRPAVDATLQALP